MNQKALKVLEYDKIIQLLAEQATSDAGKKRCLELVPMTDKQLITDAQAQTADALSRIYRKGSISFGGLKDPGFQMKRLEIGGCLNAAELPYWRSPGVQKPIPEKTATICRLTPWMYFLRDWNR